MQAFQDFGVSALLVALAEMGDRTQLLTILLATRFRRPLPIIAGVALATLANHALAALAGYYVSSFLDALWFRYLIGASFLVMAVWVLIPDKAADEGGKVSHRGVFLTTLIAFFLVEMGDKTQIATAALAARFSSVWIVTAGTTTGMLLANVPAAYFGHAITRIVPLVAMRYISAAVYALLGVASLLETAGYLD
ncbi:MAG: TMEM165/GDT1 family protein [Alphaproteobacteria bacterium]|nr:TMEM165/GDT1 family protein [Alphaproteobacteria bacterium]